MSAFIYKKKRGRQNYGSCIISVDRAGGLPFRSTLINRFARCREEASFETPILYPLEAVTWSAGHTVSKVLAVNNPGFEESQILVVKHQGPFVAA